MTAAALLVVLGAALLMQVSGLTMAMGAFWRVYFYLNRPLDIKLKRILNHSEEYYWACFSLGSVCHWTYR